MQTENVCKFKQYKGIMYCKIVLLNVDLMVGIYYQTSVCAPSIQGLCIRKETSVKPSKDLNQKIKQPKTITGPIEAFLKKRIQSVQLGYVNVNDCPAGLENRLRRVKGAKNRRKATVKIRRNLLLRLHSMLQKSF